MAIISISDSQVNGANEILVADSNSKIPTVDGSQITILNASNVASGTIAAARLDVGTTANKLVQLDGSGNLPAVDASQLTGIVSATISASDPAIDTNPSGGVGTEWNNSTSGEMFICTDATAGSNVWANVGDGTGNIAPFHYLNCTISCFAPGGGYDSAPYNRQSIDKNLFASDGNSTDQGDLTVARRGNACASSTTHGYTIGGYESTYGNTIDKFAMAATSDATDVGDLSVAGWITGIGFTSSTHGYYAAGSKAGPGIQGCNKISFSSDGAAEDLGDIVSVATDYPTGGSSATHGYILGSTNSGGNKTSIEKISWATETSTAAIGSLVSGYGPCFTMSTTGYIYGVSDGAAGSSQIDKTSTTSDGDSVDSGSDLTMASKAACAGASSTTHGYAMGVGTDGGAHDTIEKFSFASAGLAEDVGDLTVARRSIMSCGCQL